MRPLASKSFEAELQPITATHHSSKSWSGVAVTGGCQGCLLFRSLFFAQVQVTVGKSCRDCLIRQVKLALERSCSSKLLPMTIDRIRSDGVVYLPDSSERAPMSIVWTTLPGISFLFPVIGHVGIGDSSGVTYDFSGPYQVC